MQRFLAIGKARLHVLEAGVHEPREAARVRASLDALQPPRLWLDLSGPEGVAVAQHRPTNGLDKRIAALAGRAGPADANVVYRACLDWGQARGVPIRFLLDAEERPSRLDLWRLDRLVRREGFEATDATAAARRFHLHYISRVPGLVAWLDRRWTRAARNLVAAERDAGSGGIVVCAVPDGQGIADRVQRLVR